MTPCRYHAGGARGRARGGGGQAELACKRRVHALGIVVPGAVPATNLDAL